MNKGEALRQARQICRQRPAAPATIEEMLTSPWPEVQQLAIRYQEKQAQEMERLEEMLLFERRYWAAGCQWVAGVDEAGRGPLAGPVAAAAVILPPDLAPLTLWGLTDSKQLSPAQRETLEEKIKSQAVAWAVAWRNQRQIDRDNILQASLQAMGKAVAQLKMMPQQLLIDGNVPLLDRSLPQLPLVKGDSRSLSIAAASVLAKCWRDRLMIALDARYPAYGFAGHKGYGTAAHRQALRQWGPCPLHRRSFVWRRPDD